MHTRKDFLLFFFKLPSSAPNALRRSRRRAIPNLVALAFALPFLGVVFAPCEAAAVVKKSSSGICHCPGGQYYDRTKKFTAYRSIEECLASGGRHPRRGQGNCAEAAPSGSHNPKLQERRIVPRSAPTESGPAARRANRSPARVIDGDTLEISGVRIRLHGIDAPEAKQLCRHAQGGRYRCGRDATAALDRLAAGGVRCRLQRGTGRYGRKIGTCYAGDGSDINARMVRLGHALAYRKYSRKYLPEEREARARRRGLHRGAFVAPWAWRRGQRLPGR
ncbi:MAG: thermonuclease family protein [Defluviicoccus sp.]|nr:thermonuclease family protein [Defluviicoccus sp.]MDE0385799.1 thermonuclease family protein [Defluviicoccus sp.]